MGTGYMYHIFVDFQTRKTSRRLLVLWQYTTDLPMIVLSEILPDSGNPVRPFEAGLGTVVQSARAADS